MLGLGPPLNNITDFFHGHKKKKKFIEQKKKKNQSNKPKKIRLIIKIINSKVKKIKSNKLILLKTNNVVL